MHNNASRSTTIIGTVLIALVVGIVGGGVGAYLLLSVQPTGSAGGGPISLPPRTQTVRVVTDEDAIVKSVAMVDPAVVKIVATTVVEPTDPFELWFGGGSRVQQGVGSGFVFEYEGRKLVLTNTHVVGDAQEIIVQLRSGEELQGKAIAYDRASDVAVVEIQDPPEDLAVALLGDSDGLQIGEWVVAIGHPYAYFDHTVTVGVVSAQGPRQVGGAQGNQATRNVIQTDAAINQGNSGGPLIDLGGNVVGINSMIYSPTGSTVGIGFAIPINDAKQMVHFLIHGGPWVGIQRVLPNSAGLANYLRLTTDKGAVILSVVPDSPAAQAGLAQGDAILRVGDAEIATGEDLRRAIFSHKIDDTLTFTVQRGEEQLDLQVTAGRIPRNQYQ